MDGALLGPFLASLGAGKRPFILTERTSLTTDPTAGPPAGAGATPGLPVLQWQGADPKIVVLAPEKLASGKDVYPMPAFNKRG